MFLSQAFILDVGQILITQETSSIGLVSSGWQWGRVQLAGQDQDDYQIGDKVAYDPTGAVEVVFQAVPYFFIQQANIKFKINPTL